MEPEVVTKEYLDSAISNTEDRLISRMEAMEERLGENLEKRLERLETKLLSAFHGWARSMEIRVRHGSSAVAGFDERLALAEERISDLERRK